MFDLQYSSAMLIPNFQNDPVVYHEALIYLLNFLTISSYKLFPIPLNNEFKIIRKSIISNNDSHQIMKLTHLIHTCLIIFLVYYRDIINSLKSDMTHHILIQQ